MRSYTLRQQVLVNKEVTVSARVLLFQKVHEQQFRAYPSMTSLGDVALDVCAMAAQSPLVADVNTALHVTKILASRFASAATTSGSLQSENQSQRLPATKKTRKRDF